MREFCALHMALEYSQPDGKRQTLAACDFEAVVIQHEIDHLDGILFLDRVAHLATDIFPRKVAAK